MSLSLVIFAGCGNGVPLSATAQPTVMQVPSSPTPARPTLLPSATMSPSMENGFAIYLIEQNITPQQLATLSYLKLEGTPFLSMNDIVAYQKATHEIELTHTGYEKIHGLSVPMDGKAFAVCVDSRPIYMGAFWVALSSASFDGVVIEVLLVTEEHPVIRIDLGYPGPDFFRGDDPRSDARIMQALEQAGKLIK